MYKTAEVGNGHVMVGDRVRVWDAKRHALLTGTVAQIGRVGALTFVEIVSENGEYLCEWAYVCEKIIS